MKKLIFIVVLCNFFFCSYIVAQKKIDVDSLSDFSLRYSILHGDSRKNYYLILPITDRTGKVRDMEVTVVGITKYLEVFFDKDLIDNKDSLYHYLSKVLRGEDTLKLDYGLYCSINKVCPYKLDRPNYLNSGVKSKEGIDSMLSKLLYLYDDKKEVFFLSEGPASHEILFKLGFATCITPEDGYMTVRVIKSDSIEYKSFNYDSCLKRIFKGIKPRTLRYKIIQNATVKDDDYDKEDIRNVIDLVDDNLKKRIDRYPNKHELIYILKTELAKGRYDWDANILLYYLSKQECIAMFKYRNNDVSGWVENAKKNAFTLWEYY